MDKKICMKKVDEIIKLDDNSFCNNKEKHLDVMIKCRESYFKVDEKAKEKAIGFFVRLDKCYSVET